MSSSVFRFRRNKKLKMKKLRENQPNSLHFQHFVTIFHFQNTHNTKKQSELYSGQRKAKILQCEKKKTVRKLLIIEKSKKS